MAKALKVVSLYEGVTADEELHVEYSQLAQDVEIEVTGGGKLISADIYGRAADLHMTGGTKRIVVRGTPLKVTSSTLSFAVSRKGEVDIEENPLITNDDAAVALADHVANYLTMRNTYDVDYRGNPELETGDLVGLQTLFTDDMDALLLTNNLTFNGSLGGTALLKGLRRTGKVDLQSVILTIPSQRGFIAYTGETQSPVWDGFREVQLSISGVLEAVSVGVYEVEFTPKEGCVWADGTTEPKKSSWIIDYAEITEVPKQSGGLVDNGEEQLPEWESFDENKLELSIEPQNGPGTYAAEFTPKNGYVWWDGSHAAKVALWQITQARPISLPTVYGDVVYNGNTPTDGTEQSPRWSGYYEDHMVMDGEFVAIFPGTYKATFKPKGGYIWEDNTFDAKEVEWAILPKEIKRVSAESQTFTTDNKKHFPAWRDYDENQISISGDTKAQSKAGVYETVFTPKSCFVWEDTRDAEPFTIQWGIGIDPSNPDANKLEVPTVKNPVLVYNGMPQDPGWENYDPDKMEIYGDDLSGTNAITYQTTFGLKPGYTWKDGTTDRKDVHWEIVRAETTLSLSPESQTVYTYDHGWWYEGATAKITYQTNRGYSDNLDVNVRPGAGSISTTTDKITIYFNNPGTYTVEAVYWETENYTGKTARCTVIVEER